MNFKPLARSAAARFVALPGLQSSLARLGHRDLLPESVWHRLPAEGDFAIATASKRSFLYRAGPGDGLARPLRWRGLESWEAMNLLVWQRLIADAAVAFDVGANTGIYSLVALAENPTIRVVAFEPLDRIADRAQASVDLNRWEDRFVLHRVAVADRSGETEFVDPGSEIPTSARLAAAHYRSSAGEPIRLPVVALDEVEGPRPDVIKIDVEGAEDAVLSGLHRTLAGSRPSLVFECHPEGPIEFVQQILDQYEYILFHVRTDRVIAVSAIEPLPDRDQNNFVAVHRPEARAVLADLANA